MCLGRPSRDGAYRGHRCRASGRCSWPDQASCRWPIRTSGRASRCRPAGQRPGGGAAVRHAGGRRRLRHGHDVGLRGPRWGLRRWRHRAGLELGLEALAAGPQAAAGRAARPGPGHRAGHVSAIQSGTIFGYQALATGLLGGSAASWPTRRRRAADVQAILTGGLPPLRGRPTSTASRRSTRPHAQGPRHPPCRGRRRRAAELP